MRKLMHIKIHSSNGIGWEYFTAEEINVKSDGKIRVYSRDTDDKCCLDELTVNGSFDISIQGNKLEFGGFMDIENVQPCPENQSCLDCKHENDCEIHDSLREEARTEYRPCRWFMRDDFEPKKKDRD